MLPQLTKVISRHMSRPHSSLLEAGSNSETYHWPNEQAVGNSCKKLLLFIWKQLTMLKLRYEIWNCLRCTCTTELVIQTLWAIWLALTSRKTCVFSMFFSRRFGIFLPPVTQLCWWKKNKIQCFSLKHLIGVKPAYKFRFAIKGWFKIFKGDIKCQYHILSLTTYFVFCLGQNDLVKIQRDLIRKVCLSSYCWNIDLFREPGSAACDFKYKWDTTHSSPFFPGLCPHNFAPLAPANVNLGEA